MRRIVSAITFLLIMASAGMTHADLREDLQGIKQEIRERKLQLRKTKRAEVKVSGELTEIEKSLQEKEQRLVELGRQLQGVEQSLAGARRAIEITRIEAELRRERIKQRLTALYKVGEMSSARVFFASESFPTMLENIRYMRAVLDNDRRMVAEYNAKIDELRQLKVNLEREVARKESIRQDIEEKRSEISLEKTRKSAYLERIRQDKQTHIVHIKELQANARRLQTMVERLEAQSRKGYSKKSDERPGGARKENEPESFPGKGLGAQRGRLKLPVKGEIVATYGRHKHPEFNSYTVSNGISIAAPPGTEIHAIFDGQVIYADYFKGYGNMVIVDHGEGFFSLYGHAAKIVKRVGSTVSRNEAVAIVGDIDSPRGTMLYFEIRYRGKPVDPSPWFK